MKRGKLQQKQPLIAVGDKKALIFSEGRHIPWVIAVARKMVADSILT